MAYRRNYATKLHIPALEGINTIVTVYRKNKPVICRYFLLCRADIEIYKLPIELAEVKVRNGIRVNLRYLYLIVLYIMDACILW